MMICRAIAFSGLLLAPVAQSMPATTVGNNYPACRTQEWMQDLIAFTSAGDLDSFQAYLDARRCVILKPGLKVTIIDSPGMFGGLGSFVFQGIKMWTVREALKITR